MLDQNLNDQIINLRRMAAEYFQKAAWNQLLALENYQKNNFLDAERFAQLSFDDQMNGVECAHNPLVPGSSPGGPTNKINDLA